MKDCDLKDIWQLLKSTLKKNEGQKKISDAVK